MTEHFSFDDTYPRARESLKKAVTSFDNLDYAGISLSDGTEEKDRLVIAGVSPLVQRGDKFQTVFATYGWPNKMQDHLIEPVITYESDNDFIDSLKGISGQDHKLISAYFLTLLQIAPDNEPPINHIMAEAVGNYPALHRAYAIAPDLFDNLRVVLRELVKQYRELPPLDEDHLYEAITAEENQDVAMAMHMAYRILGRLLKVDDRKWVHSTITSEGELEFTPILNADEELRYGA